MIELYVVLTLSAIGYLLNSMNNTVKPKKKEINRFEMPSMDNIYNSKYTKVADDKERHLAERAYKESLKPKKTQRIMTLAGELVDEDNFKHNNMEPYFGSEVRQNLDTNINRTILENFTGVSDVPSQKCEVKSFYDQSKDLGNVYGMANNDQFYKDRIDQPNIRNNELPFSKVQVGPGLGKGYTANPNGGYQQYEIGDIARKSQVCVDNLRVKSKPKVTYDARTLDGIKTKLPGTVGKVNKNRVERFYEQTEDMLLKTTAANLKPMSHSKYLFNLTNRQSTSKEYKGSIKGPNKHQAKSRVRLSEKPIFEETGVRNAILSAFGLGTSDDYGKKNIVVYNNERDLTTTRVQVGNLTSLIKAVMAPLQDLIKNSKKQETVDNPRPYGQLNPQMPSKETMAPQDNMRTTVRETTENSADPANLKGSEKITIYNEDKARTTTRELLEEEELHKGNLKPAGPSKIQLVDTTDLARTTIKETLLQDMWGMGGTLAGPIELYVYDPDDVAKATIRETLDDEDYHANVSTLHKKATLQPDDDIRATMKETLIDNLYDAHPDAIEGQGAYDYIDVEAKLTQKAFISDKDYIGAATKDKGEGYITNEHEAKQTQKAFISDNDYYGTSLSSNKKQKSYEDMENAHVDERKEVLLPNRQPTSQGAKEFNPNIAMRIKKPECDSKSTRKLNNIDYVYQQPPQLSDRTITKNRLSVDLDIGDRLDPDLLKAYRENPYTRQIGSVA